MTEQKLKELLADMTLEEKVNQMSQVWVPSSIKIWTSRRWDRWRIKDLRRKM